MTTTLTTGRGAVVLAGQGWRRTVAGVLTGLRARVQYLRVQAEARDLAGCGAGTPAHRASEYAARDAAVDLADRVQGRADLIADRWGM